MPQIPLPRPISQAFRCFDEVARRGSIRKAATSLHLTATAVHQQILNLEAQVGTPLFDRLPRGMQLTTAGEIMIAAVRRGQRDYEDALAQVQDLRALRRGHINLAVTPSSAEQLIPAVIESALKTHPGITYGVRTGNGESILKWVANGEADIGYCLRRTPPAGVQETRAFAQQLGVVTSPGHRLASSSQPVRLRDCQDEPLVMMAPGLELREMTDSIDPRERRQGRAFVETSSVGMVCRLVAAGAGIGFLIPENVTEFVAAGRLAWTPLADAGARSHTCLYQRSGQSTAVAMGMFLQLLEVEVEAIHQRFARNAPV
jgi:DNA-binding transcriptional LysR family regulator